VTIEHNSFISKPFLRSLWALDYEAYKDTEQEQGLLKLLNDWSKRADLKETAAESAFIDTFFKTLWGYKQSGQESGKAFSIYPQHRIEGGGMKGGVGFADLALGWFGRENVPPTPQVLCEFKDIKSNLDAPQKSRKPNPRSPVKQCLDYLSAARRGLFGNESILPAWGIVTDMNEFRLYWHDRAPQQYFRFVIRPMDLFQGDSLLAEGGQARFDRFLFWRLFHSETLLTTGGRSKLEQLIAKQWVKERELENTFYKEYRAFRGKLYQALLELNPDFPGTKGILVRIAQKILDRCIFIFYCEDMGQTLSFPPQILRDFLLHESKDEYFDPTAYSIWTRMLSLFKSMNEGKPFGSKKINQFNGGLFADDPALESLKIPNSIFCRQGQGQNEASLNAHKDTVLYLSAAYNYASDMAQVLKSLPIEESDPAKALKRDPARNLGLYTLGRIFEQSITELEILEAEADGFLSINKESKRKRDGVYYTPEWVVERIVHETLGPRLAEIKQECGWPEKELPNETALDDYQQRLKKLKIVDPACGSGAFLITALRYLMDEWHAVLALRREITGKATKHDDATLIKEILKSNLYGVDINPASVEITRLALWLHTASSDKPLSSLDHTIRDGNSLIGQEFYKGQINLGLYDEVQKERINVFDWEESFPEVFEQGGFDAVVGNPPYVKLQSFRKVHADMAEFLKTDGLGNPTYKSTQSGNFDLYLPFIEKGLQLLSEDGRLGYIAPSLWTVNKYGAALRAMIAETKQLERWVDFKAFQVFDEAITYTALQFYTKRSNEVVKVASASDGKISDDAWSDLNCELNYADIYFSERWLLLTGKERKLMNKLLKQCGILSDNKKISISQGVISGAFPIFALRKVASQKYWNERHPDLGEIILEDNLMLNLVSGEDVKRYQTPKTNLCIIFPYQKEDRMKLLEGSEFRKSYPNAWSYLKKFEKDLRKRDGKKLDNEYWYAYSRNQNLDKQSNPKLLIAGTASELRVSIDADGAVAANDKRVYTISGANIDSLLFLQGVLNSPVCNFVFKRIARPKVNGFFDIEKQFIAPLPIPKATTKNKEAVALHAKTLQKLHTKRRDILTKLEKRMAAVRFKERPESFLFPDLKCVKEYIDDAPKNLEESVRKLWAKQAYADTLQSRYDEITALIHPAADMDANFIGGELRFLIDGIPVLENIFLDEEDGAFILAQWKVLAQTFSITDKTESKKLCNTLRKLATTDNPALVKQIIGLEGDLTGLEADIFEEEQEVNKLIYKLYGLTDKEIKLIEES
jgi:type I restriction-modification system DNA methylase subunit